MRSALVLVFAVGCGGGELTEAEAEAVFGAVNDVTGDVYLSASTARTGASTTGWSWEQTADGYTFTGSISGGLRWDGTIQVEASLSSAPDGMSADYTFRLDLIDVYLPSRDLTMNGWIEQTLGYAATTTSTTIVYDTAAEVSVTGAATGDASMSYTLTFTAGAGGYSVVAEGDVNGHDVAGFSTSGVY
jgi:hypothetical protein